MYKRVDVRDIEMQEKLVRISRILYLISETGEVEVSGWGIGKQWGHLPM